jgi:tRNA threonylcarbamoyladenosine biosynthesis protein TsaB
MSDRLIFAIDTSFGPVGIALATLGHEVIAAVEADNPAGTQAETLPPLAAEMFKSAGASFGQLARIAVTVGPGAFTGVRVGLAFAKGIRLATGATLLGVTTLECLAAQAARAIPGRNVGVAIDAKRGEVYAQAFDPDLRPLADPALLPVETVAVQFRAVLGDGCALTGSGAALLADALGPGTEIVESARIDVKLLALRMIDKDPARYSPVPAYLRAPDARLPS